MKIKLYGTEIEFSKPDKDNEIEIKMLENGTTKSWIYVNKKQTKKLIKFLKKGLKEIGE